MSFLLKIENIAKSSKILISGETFFSRSKDRSRTHDQKINHCGKSRHLPFRRRIGLFPRLVCPTTRAEKART